MAISSFQEASVAQLRAELGSKLPIAGGKILQIVRATDSTNRTTTSTSYVDANISVTITPQKSDSAVLLIATGGYVVFWQSATFQFAQLQITDSSNNAISGTQSINYGLENITGSSFRNIYGGYNIMAYATPATTSAVTYKLRFKIQGSDVNIQLANAAATGQMYAIEVSA